VPFGRRFDYLVKGNSTYKTYNNYRPFFGHKGILQDILLTGLFSAKDVITCLFSAKIERTSILQSRPQVASTVRRVYEGTNHHQQS
jgi:hypothetical protein